MEILPLPYAQVQAAVHAAKGDLNVAMSQLLDSGASSSAAAGPSPSNPPHNPPTALVSPMPVSKSAAVSVAVGVSPSNSTSKQPITSLEPLAAPIGLQREKSPAKPSTFLDDVFELAPAGVSAVLAPVLIPSSSAATQTYAPSAGGAVAAAHAVPLNVTNVNISQLPVSAAAVVPSGPAVVPSGPTAFDL